MKKVNEMERIKVKFNADKVYVNAYDIFEGTPEHAIEKIHDILTIAKEEYPDATQFWFENHTYDDLWPELYGERYENDEEYALRMQELLDDQRAKKEKAQLKLEAEQREYERLKAKFEKKL